MQQILKAREKLRQLVSNIRMPDASQEIFQVFAEYKTQRRYPVEELRFHIISMFMVSNLRFDPICVHSSFSSLREHLCLHRKRIRPTFQNPELWPRRRPIRRSLLVDYHIMPACFFIGRSRHGGRARDARHPRLQIRHPRALRQALGGERHRPLAAAVQDEARLGDGSDGGLPPRPLRGQ